MNNYEQKKFWCTGCEEWKEEASSTITEEGIWCPYCFNSLNECERCHLKFTDEKLSVQYSKNLCDKCHEILNEDE